ncbi:MAG: GNVR domain-containing protein [Armatimonas sp.]
MSCRSEDLPLLATGRLTGLALWRMERHVKQCSICQQELHALRDLSDSLRATLQAPPSADLDERVLSIRADALQKSRASTQNRPLGGSFMRHPLLLSPLLGISCAAMFTMMQPPAYTAIGRLLVVSPNKDPMAVSTLVELMKASDIRGQVFERFKTSVPTFTIETINNTPIIQVTGSASTPESAGNGVNFLMHTIQEQVEAEKVIVQRRNAMPNSGPATLPSFDGEVRIIDSATMPNSPSTPGRPLALAVGLLAGIFLGGLLTFFRRPS